MEKPLVQELDKLMRFPEGTLRGPEELSSIKSWDSLAIIEFISLVDERTGVDIAPDQVRKCKRVQDLLDLAGEGVAG